MGGFSLRQFIFEQYCLPWKLRLLIRRIIPWQIRRTLVRGQTNLNRPAAMDKTYAALDDEFSSMENLYEHLLPLLPHEGRLIDMGCGIAVLLRWIRQRCPELELFGQDFSQVAVDRTRGYGFQAWLARLPDVPFPDAHFDGVVCTEVLEHLDDPLTAIKAFCRALKPGGRLVVSVPRGMGPDECDEHVQDFNEQTLRELLTRGGLEVVSIEPVVREPERCDAASFLALAVKPTTSRRYGRDYYARRSQHPMWMVEAKLLRDLAGKSAGGVVVDVGCGAGELLAFLAPAVGVGVDNNRTAVEMAKPRFDQYTFRCGDAAELGVEDGSVDCIVGMHLIEHLESPDAALSAWRRALRPGGRVVLTTPNGAFSHPEEFDDPDHKHIYSGPELKRALERAGFRVARVLSVGVWGVRRWPFFWRLQFLVGRWRLPRVPGLRWRGQSLCIAAVREGDE